MHYEAGIWEQGRGFLVWSRHRDQARAEAAARRYARRCRAATGGALSWSGGWRRNGGAVTWVETPPGG